MRTRFDDCPAYATKDGSMIRELMHPLPHGAGAAFNQSLAEAVVPPLGATALHAHRVAEEFYHFTLGTGRMTLGEAVFDVAVGDTVRIPPKTPHRVENTGPDPLVFLCCCSPPYRHEDTDLLD